jgi:hypothetical protein
MKISSEKEITEVYSNNPHLQRFCTDTAVVSRKVAPELQTDKQIDCLPD